MTRQWIGLVAVAMIIIPLAVPATAQMPAPPAASPCPPGTQYVPPGRDGAGNATMSYCAAAPAQGTYDPYTGRNAPDPQANPATGGPGQYIPKTR